MSKIIKFKSFESNHYEEAKSEIDRLHSILHSMYRISIGHKFDELFLELIDKGFTFDYKTPPYLTNIFMSGLIDSTNPEKEFEWIIKLLKNIVLKFDQMYQLQSHFSLKINGKRQHQDINPKTMKTDIYSFSGIGNQTTFKGNPMPKNKMEISVDFYIV